MVRRLAVKFSQIKTGCNHTPLEGWHGWIDLIMPLKTLDIRFVEPAGLAWFVHSDRRVSTHQCCHGVN